MTEFNIKSVRRAAELSQQQLAALAGTSQTEISMIERGERMPRPKTAKKIAAVLGFDWQKFYEDAE